MLKEAVLSDCGQYRYMLARVWDKSLPMCCFVMLNGSTADAEQDDPTVRRGVGFAKNWGYGGYIAANLFGFRATQPEDMRKAADPIGPENDCYILACAQISGLVVCAWGNHGKYMNRSATVLKLLRANGIAPFALRIGKTGEPAHPLYLKANLRPTPLH